jgi:hypothetical protein
LWTTYVPNGTTAIIIIIIIISWLWVESPSRA